MWGRKEDSTATPDGETPAEAPKLARPEPQPAPQPVTAPSPAPRATSSAGGIVGKSLKIKGEITGNESLYIDGEVEGRIALQGNTLTVGPNGKVRAEVAAHSITILGHLEGNVRAEDRMEIRKTGSLEGDLVTARIAIEEDAVFRGSIDIVKPGSKPAVSSDTSSAPTEPSGKAGAATKPNSPA